MKDGLLFSKDHIWIRIDEDKAKLGMTDHAQSKLKSILFINLPDEGENVKIGERMGDVESIKTVSDLISPITGIVTSVNESIMDEPYLVNEEPYESWLIEIKVDKLSDNLMDEAQYLEKCNV